MAPETGKPVILAANKCEGRLIEPAALADVFALGFGEPLKISAEHALGMESLAAALEPLAPKVEVPDEDQEAIEAEEPAEDTDAEEEAFDYRTRPLRLALVGRPNVGKSSLFNQLLGEDRSITGPEAGLTRDSIAAPWRIDVPRQSAPVSPPPMITTCLPVAVI